MVLFLESFVHIGMIEKDQTDLIEKQIWNFPDNKIERFLVVILRCLVLETLPLHPPGGNNNAS